MFHIYTMERHPGEPGYKDYQHTLKNEQRLDYAKDWSGRTGLPVAVDPVGEQTLKLYGEVPNPAFVVDRDGILVFKSTWADSRKIEIIISHLLKS